MIEPLTILILTAAAAASASERFAAVLRSTQVEALKAVDDAMDGVGVAANALKNQLGAVFAPTVQRAPMPWRKSWIF